MVGSFISYVFNVSLLSYFMRQMPMNDNTIACLSEYVQMTIMSLNTADAYIGTEILIKTLSH